MRKIARSFFAVMTCSAIVTAAIGPFAFGETSASTSLGISQTKPESGRYVELDGFYMVPYTHSIPELSISFEMIPIPGGEILIGSPESEPGHLAEEGPQFTVVIPPFWMAKTELTWGEYRAFMRSYNVFRRLRNGKIRVVNESNQADAVTAPTPLYDPSLIFSFGEDNRHPAVTMTQYAAKQYTKWLSGLTNIQYRLPTEAEWEYGARGGTQTPYSFGDDPAELGKYAHYEENVLEGPGKVGTKLPNPFGLHDMHGNVWEWTIDQFDSDTYRSYQRKKVSWLDAICWPTHHELRAARGGGWQDPPSRLRSAARLYSEDRLWKDIDPCVPQSPWWFTDAPSHMVGMRLVRSAKPLEKSLISKFWEIDNEEIREDVKASIDGGRGVQGIAVPEILPEFKR